jgi:hypothetical protein
VSFGGFGRMSREIRSFDGTTSHVGVILQKNLFGGIVGYRGLLNYR